MTPPRGLEPTGILLVDKPAGPSSFAIVADVRRRTGARTGHAGTLDPFATGLLLLLSGRATKLAGSFVGLDKRYLTDVDDLRAGHRLRDRRCDGREKDDGDDEHDDRAAADHVGAHARTSANPRLWSGSLLASDRCSSTCIGPPSSE